MVDVSLYRDDGVVLRTQKLGEADRIVTVLTRRCGRVRAVAKGVRRTKSRFGARVEPFTHVDLMFYTGRTLDVITQAESLRSYGDSLVGDYARYTTGVAMLETAERFTTVEKEPALRQFLLLVGGLRTLVDGEHEPRLVLDAYLLRSLAVAGYAPALDECAICGTRALQGPRSQTSLEPGDSRRPLSVRRTFGVAAGGLVCRSCHAPGAATTSAATIDLMSALLRGEWGLADLSERRNRPTCNGTWSTRSAHCVTWSTRERRAAPRRQVAGPASVRCQAAGHPA